MAFSNSSAFSSKGPSVLTTRGGHLGSTTNDSALAERLFRTSNSENTICFYFSFTVSKLELVNLQLSSASAIQEFLKRGGGSESSEDSVEKKNRYQLCYILSSKYQHLSFVFCLPGVAIFLQIHLYIRRSEFPHRSSGLSLQFALDQFNRFPPSECSVVASSPSSDTLKCKLQWALSTQPIALDSNYFCLATFL